MFNNYMFIDDMGIQWDGIGVRQPNGLSNQTQEKFKEMAQCIIDEYGGFQPLDPSKYNPSHLNGENTQGENIADNGGEQKVGLSSAIWRA